ncbi:MAG: xanthine dehydrogenase YagR molybdenum-binding subunit [Myxococcales bacterium]|nr:xanthine dehydrogenase YagR molybdenum-binding subunit [Myxococcales bacterium]
MSFLMKIVERVAKVMPDRAPDELRDGHEHIGKPYDRLDGRAKVTGAAKFAAEIELAGLVHAALVYSNIAKGTILSIDTALAEAALGVIAVITHENAPEMNAPALPHALSTDSAGDSVNVLNTVDVVYDGQPVAIVVADTLDRAEHAASLVRVLYLQQHALLSFEEAKGIAERPKQVVGEDAEVEKGNAEPALRQAPFSVDRLYKTPRYNQNAIEPHATTAVWNGNELTLYDATQYVRGVADTVAHIFSLEKGAVRVLSPFVGGGFGGKAAVWCHVQLCAAAAKVVKRPVRLALSRAGVYRIVGGRTLSEQRVALGARANGVLTSLIHTGVTANAMGNDWPEQFTFPARHLYAAENLRVDQTVARLNMTANSWMRAPGESIGTFALESAIDELAYALDMDPIELRKRNEPARDPVKDTPFSSRHLLEAYRRGAAKFRWADRPRQPGTMRDGDWRVGRGVASASYPMYRLQSAARVRINADGTALVQSSAQEMGMGTATVQTQHAAERLGLPMEKVRFEYGDTALPIGNQAGGSSQTVSIALAVQLAFEKVAAELLALAKKAKGSPLAGKSLAEVQARRGGLYLRERGEVGETYATLIARSGKDFVEAEAKAGQPLEMLKYSMHSFGAQFCEVRVHAQTGEVRIARWLGVFDVGRIVNPKLAFSQLRGAIVMGIGMTLTEETLFDERTGRIVNPNLSEYHLPVHADVPAIDVEVLDVPDPHTPMGARGIGEIGITGASAAIANAVFHATGKRIRELPITLDKLL